MKTMYIPPKITKNEVQMESAITAGSVNKEQDPVFTDKSSEVSISKQKGFEEGSITISNWDE